MRSFNLLLELVQAGKYKSQRARLGIRLLTAIRLSALMISKLGMSAQDSIEEYEIVSEMIFKDGRHRRGKMSKGFLLPRYCGKHFSRTIHNLFEKKGANSNLPMSSLNTITNEFTHW